MESEKVTMSESNSNTQCDKRRQKMTEMATFRAQKKGEDAPLISG